MTVVKSPEFITAYEASVLSEWVLANHSSPYFSDANMGGSRKTTRYTPSADFAYPKEALNIRKRIVRLLGLEDNETYGIYPPFKDGIVASYAPPGDSCYEHTDPVWHKGFHTLHCNVLSQAPSDGGYVFVNGEKHVMQERELFCYLVSRDLHQITEVLGNKPRLMWVFGFCITDDDWRRL